MFSGGNDSTILAHMMWLADEATHFAHANTGIGIEDTREFVRKWSQMWGVPLLEFSPDAGVDDYETLVMEQGFPGPAHHYKMYQRLKERQFRKVRRELVKHPTRERVMFIAGRRRAESDRREDIPEHEREGSTVWVSPLANWTAEHMALYRERHWNDLPHNEVSDHLHMSGECLCGAFASPGEIAGIELFYPEDAARIHALEQQVLDAGRVDPERCRWGWGAYRDWPETMRPKTGRACSSCAARFAPAVPVEVT